MKNKFVVVTHAVLSDTKDIAGPAHNIVSYLVRQKADYLFIRHALNEDNKTLISSGNSTKKTDNFKVDSHFKFGELGNRIIEGIRTIRIVSNSTKSTKPIYIGIDPLNSLWGLILKKMGKVSMLISFTVDYSPQRFENKILNKIYHLIDRITLRFSDKAWVVSERIYDLRTKQGKNPSDITVVPNAPSNREVERLVKKQTNPFNLITIGTITRAVDFGLIIDSVGEIYKKFPKIKLTIIGQGNGMDDLKKEIEKRKLSKNIFLTGSKTHGEVFKILSDQGIGIAMYTDNASWSYYSDSMKARDYLALGLPVIISGNIGTAEEIKNNNAGILIKREKNQLVNSIEKLITDKGYYDELRRNALKLARDCDTEKILDKALEELI